MLGLHIKYEKVCHTKAMEHAESNGITVEEAQRILDKQAEEEATRIKFQELHKLAQTSNVEDLRAVVVEILTMLHQTEPVTTAYPTLTTLLGFLTKHDADSFWDHCKTVPVGSPNDWVLNAFQWKNTPEGYQYWSNINLLWVRNHCKKYT